MRMAVVDFSDIQQIFTRLHGIALKKNNAFLLTDRQEIREF
jgi:hypothetical protein